MNQCRKVDSGFRSVGTFEHTYHRRSKVTGSGRSVRSDVSTFPKHLRSSVSGTYVQTYLRTPRKFVQATDITKGFSFPIRGELRRELSIKKGNKLERNNENYSQPSVDFCAPIINSVFCWRRECCAHYPSHHAPPTVSKTKTKYFFETMNGPRVMPENFHPTLGQGVCHG